jgi:prepilin-type N-terminal cleavage/methylation domain-containing protein
MSKRGYTLLEMLIVVVLLGVLMALAIPRLQSAFAGSSTRSARSALTTLVAKARAAAVARGCRAAVHFTSAANGSAWVTVCGPDGGVDTVGGVEQIGDRFHVAFTATRESVTFAPSGISFDNVSTTLWLTAGSRRDSVVINPIGKVMR